MTHKFTKAKALTAREEAAVLLPAILILTLISVLVLSWAQAWRTELKLAGNFGEAHMCQRLAVQTTGLGINLNTAPVEVLLAWGFAPDTAQNILAARQAIPFRNLQEIPQVNATPWLGQGMQSSFQSSSFFTITSTGMVKKDRGRQTIKALVRLNANPRVPWVILSWYGGFPG